MDTSRADGALKVVSGMARKPMKIKIKHPGALTRKAAAAGESVSEFAASHLSTPGPTGVQSRLYHNVFAPASKKRHKVASAHLKRKGA